MRFWWGRQDGGKESHVYGYGLEVKSLFSVLLLRFEHGSREAFHSHAFNAISWVLRGWLEEHRSYGRVVGVRSYAPRLKPIITTRDNLHRVYSIGRSWVFTLRGPWQAVWQEVRANGTRVALTHGRKEL